VAITVSGADPTQVTAGSNTVTTNTAFNTNAPNDRDYILADNIVGRVNVGVTVGGFGLFLLADRVNGSVAMTNNGAVVINEFTDALVLEGNGGLVTYTGSGIVTNTGTGRALFLDNSSGDSGGNINAVINSDITANTASAILLNTGGLGVATFTLAAGTLVSNTPGNDDTIDIFAEGGIVANLNGTITGGGTGFRATSNGAISINTAADIDGDDRVLQATGNGAGPVIVNMTGGEVHGTFGIDAIANGNGGATVNLSGGQVGSAAQPVSENGLRARTSGTAGNATVTTSAGTTIFGATGILADIDNAASTGNINVTVNGTIDLAFFGVFTGNAGIGSTNITINGTVVGNTGIAVGDGAANAFIAGTVTGAGGTAIDLGAGNDTLTITRTSVINGDVLAQGGNDTLRLGGSGTGNFDVGDIGFGQQYDGFETFNVVSGTWLLTGASGENWNVLGGTLGGTALINVVTVNAGATVAPGASAGTLSTGQVTFAAGARFAVEIGGTAAGQFDQLDADGIVRLGGATLSVSRFNGFVPTPGDTFTIIENDTALAVTGTFAGLPEGETIFQPGSGAYRISYAGGDGNDVTLTALAFVAQGSGDLNGNGSDHLLWRHGGTGELLRWTVVGNQVQQVSLGNLDLNLAVAGIGDFDGNGVEELVYRHVNGELFVDGVSRGILDNVLAIAGVGDFNGDGRDEFVYRHVNGELFVDGVSRGILDNVLTIAGIGDFNGDGRDEFVYRHVNGELFVDGVSRGILDNVWAIEGVGDFNGDGRDELVLRHANGEVLIDGFSIGVLDNVFNIDFIGDFDGNGTDELLFRHDNGTVLLNGQNLGNLEVF
jgi:hypothetical protein